MTIGKNGDYNYGFWGQDCGPEKDFTPQKIHKYFEDAISVNTSFYYFYFYYLFSFLYLLLFF
jgi:hypothetical protein